MDLSQIQMVPKFECPVFRSPLYSSMVTYFQGRFTDLARQLEMFFLQKRFLVHAHKPELILKEDSTDLRAELQKKDELIRRHYEKLSQWQALLQDMQAGSPPTPPAANAGVAGVQSAGKLQPGSPMQQPGPGAPPGGFVPGNNYRMNPPPQSPLAYLEKTTSNLGR